MPPVKAAAKKAGRVPAPARPNPIEDEDVDDYVEDEAPVEDDIPNPEDFPDLTAYGELTDDDEVPDLKPRYYKILAYPVVDDEIDFDADPKEMVFRFRREAPMGSMMNVMGSFAGMSEGQWDIPAICRFLTSSIASVDRVRWMRALDDDHWFIKADVLGEIGADLAEKYLGRPLGSRSERRAGARRARATSGARSSARRRSTSGR